MVAEVLDHLGARTVAATCYPQCLVESKDGPIILEVPTTKESHKSWKSDPSVPSLIKNDVRTI